MKLDNFILKWCHFGNIGKYIYFTHEAYGPIGGKQTEWWEKLFLRVTQDIKVFIPHKGGFVIFGYSGHIWP